MTGEAGHGMTTQLTTAMTLDEAQRLHDAALAAIGGSEHHPPVHKSQCALCADRERLASDLAGLDGCYRYTTRGRALDRRHESHAHRYSDGLRRTAALYGVTS